MAKVLRKLDTGEELLGLELETSIKTLKDAEGKALKENEIEIIGSTPATDRDGESISIDGWDLKKFKKNPVILPQHDYRKPAIGKATKISVQDGKLVFKIEFPEEGINPEADVYRKLYKSGFMNASSVGFIPIKWEDGDGKKEPYRKYTKAELLELSLVSVPANGEALVIGRSAVAKGIVTEEEVRSIGLELSKEKDVQQKSDPSMDMDYVMSPEHREHHRIIDERLENIDKQLTFISGVLQGMKKPDEEVSEMKSYIKELLGVGCAKSTEDQTVTSDELIGEIKNIFKGE